MHLSPTRVSVQLKKCLQIMELNGIRFCYTLLTINHLAKANVANKEFLTHSAWLGRGFPNKSHRESTLYIYHFKSFPFLLRSSHKTNFQFKPYYQFLFSFAWIFILFGFVLFFNFRSEFQSCQVFEFPLLENVLMISAKKVMVVPIQCSRKVFLSFV